ncbi:SAVMC3_10250 family protein [Streptomyces spectabilis]|uniref:SAVMC3_10250 family protein n=1 Tax=Streptomyces spectabilis TaxID=68270 RepID=UPI0039A607DB
MKVRECFYFSPAKLNDFSFEPRLSILSRLNGAGATILGSGAHLSFKEGAAPGVVESKLEAVIRYLKKTYRAHTDLPETCTQLMARDWLEFSGVYKHGPAVRDCGLLNQNVYAFASLEDSPCHTRQTDECPRVQILLCGSLPHVQDYADRTPTRMGSGSDWLHDFAATLVQRESQGDASLPSTLFSTHQNDQEFAARSCYPMVEKFFRDGPSRFHGHARVLCNFSPERRGHRLIVATPLYVEPEKPPRSTASRVSRLMRRG